MKAPLSPALHRLVASLESVERLEILLHVRNLRGRRVTAPAIAATFRVSASSAEQHLSKLCACGYLAVEIGTALHYTYRPISTSIREAVDEAELRRAELVTYLT